MRLAGKVAFITGAGLGIGRAAAGLFAAEGARVVLADINEEKGRESAALAGDSAFFVQTDVTDPAAVQNAFARTVQKFGKLDVLYNNAGGSRPGDGQVTDVADQDFWRAIKVDLYGTWLCCKFGIPEIIKAGGGAIINTSSMVAKSGFPGMDAYTAAKGGVASLTRSMAVEYAPHGIRVNAVAPGMTLTERGAKWVAEGHMPQAMRDRHLLGTLEPLDIARAALFLASDDARHLTGQILSVDSGYTTS